MDERTLKAWAAAASIIAVVTTYFAGPVLRFVPGGLIATVGILLAFSAALTWRSLFDDKPTWVTVVGLAMTISSFVGLTGAAFFGSIRSDLNDARCANVQREMLLPNPRRDDLPDIFTALGCRPQGTDDIQFPKPETNPKTSKAK